MIIGIPREIKDKEFRVAIVPAGVEHRVVPQGHVKRLLFEPAGIAHTGAVRAEITRDHYERLDP